MIITTYSVSIALYYDYPCEEFTTRTFLSEDEALSYAADYVRTLLNDFGCTKTDSAVKDMRDTLEEHTRWEFSDEELTNYYEVNVLFTRAIFEVTDTN